MKKYVILLLLNMFTLSCLADTSINEEKYLIIKYSRAFGNDGESMVSLSDLSYKKNYKDKKIESINYYSKSDCINEISNYIKEEISGDTEAGLGVFCHEIGHSMYGDDEDTANYLGSRFTDTYTDGLWINGVDSNLGTWISTDINSLYIVQNNLDYAKVENKEDCGPLCLSVLGVGAIISGIGAYKGGEAKAIVDYGYLGNDEYMRPDGTHISGEDLKTNLKIYGTMDIGGNLLMAGVPFMEGSSVKKGLGGNPFKGKTEKQIEKMFRAKNFEMRGSSNEFGGYVNTKTGRSYHIDFNNRFNEKPHVDINSLYKSNSLKLKKTKYFIDGNIEKIIK